MCRSCQKQKERNRELKATIEALYKRIDDLETKLYEQAQNVAKVNPVQDLLQSCSSCWFGIIDMCGCEFRDQLQQETRRLERQMNWKEFEVFRRRYCPASCEQHGI